MTIPEDTLNSCLEYCIDEYVRLIDHREILRLHWFQNFSAKELSDKYNLSVTRINEIFRIGDKIILRAAKLSKSKE